VPNSSNELDFSGFVVTSLINCTIFYLGSVWLGLQKGGVIRVPLKLGESVSDRGVFCPEGMWGMGGARKNLIRCHANILYNDLEISLWDHAEN
jgi:hypothetical protein